MKYALCCRGISYYKNYIHKSYQNPDPYDIDFEPCIPHLNENVINPLRQRGDDIDIFFNTYDSEKLSKYRNLLNPVYTRLTKFNPDITYCNWSNVFQLKIDSLNMVKEYENNKNIKYDFIILTRFDYVILENITNLFIPENSISSTTEGDDYVYIITRNLLDEFINILTEMKFKTDTHQILKFAYSSGMRCHLLYPQYENKTNSNRPFGRLARSMFNKKDHVYKIHDLEEAKDSSSEFYAFRYKPTTEYTPPKFG